MGFTETAYVPDWVVGTRVAAVERTVGPSDGVAVGRRPGEGVLAGDGNIFVRVGNGITVPASVGHVVTVSVVGDAGVKGMGAAVVHAASRLDPRTNIR